MNDYSAFISEPKYISGNVLVWPFRNIVYGPSGSGKTNFVFNLLFDHVYYNKLDVCAKLLDEQKYEFLQHMHKKLSERPAGEDVAFFSDDEKDIIDVNDLDESKQNHIVIDDFGSTRNKLFWERVPDLFRMSTKNCSIVFIAYNLHSIPLVLKRNCNYIILFGFRVKRDMTTFDLELTLK